MSKDVGDFGGRVVFLDEGYAFIWKARVFGCHVDRYRGLRAARQDKSVPFFVEHWASDNAPQVVDVLGVEVSGTGMVGHGSIDTSFNMVVRPTSVGADELVIEKV